MLKPPKTPLNKLIELMEPEHKRVATRICQEYERQMIVIPGASHNHQTWPGGYTAHIEEAMNIVNVLYDSLSDLRPLEFTRSQALFCVFMHDFDKIQRYQLSADGTVIKGKYDKDYIRKTVEILKNQYNYTLAPEEFNAIKYAHGEGDDYQNTRRIMLPLATLVHCADVISARIWPEKGHRSDSWAE